MRVFLRTLLLFFVGVFTVIAFLAFTRVALAYQCPLAGQTNPFGRCTAVGQCQTFNGCGESYCNSNTDCTNTGGPRGLITASPNPCTIASGNTHCQSTIFWNTQNASNVCVIVGNTLFVTGIRGSATTGDPPGWIQPPPGNLFILYANCGDPINYSNPGLELSRVTVYGVPAGGLNPNGTISANPNPCSIPVGATPQECTSTITWSSQNANNVCVAAPGRDNTAAFACQGPNSQKDANWITVSGYDFILYRDFVSMSNRGTEMARVNVKGLATAVTAQLNPIQVCSGIYGVATITASASVNFDVRVNNPATGDVFIGNHPPGQTPPTDTGNWVTDETTFYLVAAGTSNQLAPPLIMSTTSAGCAYTVSGNVFVDDNKDGFKNDAEANYSEAITVSAAGGTTTYPATGAYTITVPEGNYTVTASVPAGYNVSEPPNGPPPSFIVSVGRGVSGSPACSPGTSPTPKSATCDANNNISNLNFGITNAIAWMQCRGGDCRFDPGLDNPIPTTATPQCGGAYASTITNSSSNQPGVIMSGRSTPIFGDGSASTTNWVIGGSTYPEVFSPANAGVIRTSYQYMLTTAQQNGIVPIDLASVCNLSGCDLPDINGVYRAEGDVTLNAHTFPAGKNYVFLINGNLTINGNILVPAGSTATFSSSRNITVSQNVGQAVATSNNPNIEGFYSADNSFTIQGAAACPVADRRLNIYGSVVVNAALGGGSFQNNRDLCAGNLQCPSFTITQRPDLILNAPQFIKNRSSIWQEVAP